LFFEIFPEKKVFKTRQEISKNNYLIYAKLFKLANNNFFGNETEIFDLLLCKDKRNPITYITVTQKKRKLILEVEICYKNQVYFC